MLKRFLVLAIAATISASSAAQTETPPEAPRFDILEYRVEGNRLIDSATIAGAVRPYTGKSRDFGDVQQALEAIEELYARAGWGSVQVVLPEQVLEEGRITIRVIEARVVRISVEGNRYFGEENVRASVPGLRVGETPRPLQMEASVRLANENPAKQTAVVLRAGEAEGELEAVLRVADQPPRRLSLSLDDTGNRQTGRWRLGAGFLHANVFDRDHVLNAQFVTSPSMPERVRILGLGYRIPLYGWGDSIDLGAGYSNVDSGVLQQLFAVRGAGRAYSARYTRNFARTGGGWEPKLVFGLDRRDILNDATLVGTGIGLLPDISLRPASLGFSLARRGEGDETAASVIAVRNLPGGKRGGAADFAATRAGADPRYTLWRFSFSHFARFAGGWQWRLALSGQWTRDALVPGEQFGLGGHASVRGFLEREISNDRGHQGTVELYTPDFGGRLAEGMRLRALLFHDFGRVSRVRALPGELEAESVSSLGVGLRAGIGERFTLRLDYGVVRQPGGGQGRGEGRLHLGMIYQHAF